MKNIFHKFLSRIIAVPLCLAAVLIPINSHAFLIDSDTPVDTSFTINYLLAAGNSDGNGNENVTGQDITGTAVFTLKVFDTTLNFITLAVELTNTSNDNGINVGWQKIAFATNPTATEVVFMDVADGEFISAQHWCRS